jgi:biopolymer transport protein ExbB
MLNFNSVAWLELVKLHLDAAIFLVLGLMSVVMLTLVIERWLYYWFIPRRWQRFQRLDVLDCALTDHLTTVASIGANAPYVGLLGTVLGIMVTFYDIGQSGRIEAHAIMLGLALALKATALGLVVAMPSLWFYNSLLRKVEVLKVLWLNQREKETGQDR